MTTINQFTTMVADVTVFEIPVNSSLEIGATSGTVTVQINLNGTYFNTDTTIANGSLKTIENIQQGKLIKVTGGNAIIHCWA